MYGLTHPEFLPDQVELSRQAARRFAHSTAARSRRRDEPARRRPVRRLRHALAVRLVATARLVDAT